MKFRSETHADGLSPGREAKPGTTVWCHRVIVRPGNAISGKFIKAAEIANLMISIPYYCSKNVQEWSGEQHET
jgi:hypothetical protein